MKSENVKMKTRTDYRATSVKQMSTVHTRVDKDLPTGFFFTRKTKFVSAVLS